MSHAGGQGHIFLIRIRRGGFASFRAAIGSAAPARNLEVHLSAEAQISACPYAASAVMAASAPSHVPAELVRDPALFDQPNMLLDPFSVSERAWEDLPPVFYWPKVRPGISEGFWVVTHYEDIREVYQNSELYSNKGAVDFPGLVGETFRMIPLAIDPPEHGKYRIMLNPWFSPKAVTAIEPAIRSTINDLIDGFVDKGDCDVAYDFGRLYPVRVFLTLMGLSLDKIDEFLSWEYAILHSEHDVERMKWGVSGALAYLRQFIDEIRDNPREGLASKIVHGTADGRPLNDDEIIGTIFFLWVGGLDTVAATTALMFRRLALEPALQQSLRNNPALIPEAIEEFLRVQPLVNSSRLVKKDHEIRGVRIRAGERVMCLNLAGNFDPAEFECPRSIRFDRPSNRHFTLAGGPHRCLGSHLARRELGIALGEFLRRVPPFQLRDGGQGPVVPGLIAIGRVPIRWDAQG